MPFAELGHYLIDLLPDDQPDERVEVWHTVLAVIGVVDDQP
jgi:hypothetical protein